MFPAHAAAKEGNLRLLSMLIKEGHCGINDKDKNGSTPAHKGLIISHYLCVSSIASFVCLFVLFLIGLAAGNGQVECLQWLIDHGADSMLCAELPQDQVLCMD